jgi:hypothetical protein
MKLIKLLAIGSILSITGCTTVPVTAKFPDAPIMILEKCPQLKKIDGENVSIVDFTKTVTLNYTTYYECAVKNDAWIEWYQTQKKIFEEIN